MLYLNSVLNNVFTMHVPIHMHVYPTGATGNSLSVYVTVAIPFVILFFLGTFAILSTTVYYMYKIKKAKGRCLLKNMTC